MEVQPDIIADRAYALRTCPARAPDRLEDDSVFGDDPYDMQANAVADELQPVMDLAHAYLDACPGDQPGGEPGFDLPGHKVIVQVTYGAEQVLSDLQAQLDDPSTVTVELVRYSAVRLQRWADEITAMPDDVGICGVGWGGENNRIDVDVFGDAEEAWRRIAAVVDPCAFRVEGGVMVIG
jgi:hypothetical protein